MKRIARYIRDKLRRLLHGLNGGVARNKRDNNDEFKVSILPSREMLNTGKRLSLKKCAVSFLFDLLSIIQSLILGYVATRL